MRYCERLLETESIHGKRQHHLFFAVMFPVIYTNFVPPVLPVRCNKLNLHNDDFMCQISPLNTTGCYDEHGQYIIGDVYRRAQTISIHYVYQEPGCDAYDYGS